MGNDVATTLDIFNYEGHAQQWKLRAACKDIPVEVFFPPAGKEAVALAICSECPVRKECLEFALDYEGPDRDRHGVFGGMTPEDRIAEYRRRYPKRKVRTRSASIQKDI